MKKINLILICLLLISIIGLCFFATACNSCNSCSTPSNPDNPDTPIGPGPDDPSEPDLNLFSLNTYDIEIQVDGSFLIVASIGNDNVTWNSSDESIVTVNNGLINGITVGEAYIRVNNEDDNAICHVKVIEKKNLVATLNLGVSKTSLFIGKSLNLGAYFSYDNEPVDNTSYTLEYKTDDENIVSVSDDGVITANSEGTTYVYVTCVYQGLYYEEKISVKVSNPANYFELGKKNYVLAYGTTVSGNGNSVMTEETIDFEVYADNEKLDKDTLDISYVSGNDSIVTVSDTGLMTATGIGSTSVSIIFEDKSIEVNVVVGTPISEVEDLTILSEAYKNASDKSVQPALWENDKVYVLTNDIDFNGASFLGIATVYRAKDSDGYWWQTSNQELNSPEQFTFSGVINGAGHKILNMKLMPVWSQYNYYFFKGANFIGHLGGTLENIAFINVTTYGNGSTPVAEAGLIGYLRKNAKLDNVYLDATFNCARFDAHGAALACYWNNDYGQGDTVSVTNCIVNVKYNDSWEPVETYNKTSMKEGAFIESPNAGGSVTNLKNCYVISSNMTSSELYGAELYITEIYKNFTELLKVKSIDKFADEGFEDFIIDIVGENLYDLTFTKKSLTLVHGNTVGGDANTLLTSEQLEYTAYYSGIEQNKSVANVTFNSSDENVFTVTSSGLVNATGRGTATLIATYMSTTVNIPVTVGTPISSVNDMNVLAIAYAKGNHETLWSSSQYYVLTNDIDYTEQGRLLAIAPVAAHPDARYNEWYDNGISGYLVNSPRNNENCALFYGTIDGVGHKIMNAKLSPIAYAWGDTWNSGVENAGFLQGTNFIGHLAGTVKNLAFTNLTYEYPNQAVQFAGLFGYLRSGANVENILVDINVSVAAFNVESGVLASYWNYDGGAGNNVRVKNVIIKAELDSSITDWTTMGYSELDTSKVYAFIPSVNDGNPAKVSEVYILSKTYKESELGDESVSDYLAGNVYSSRNLFVAVNSNAYLINKGFTEEIISLI